MNTVVIDATKSSPKVLLDPSAGILEIKGKSYPENVTKFYAPIMEGLRKTLETSSCESITVEIELVYLNSSSSKVLFDIFDMLTEFLQSKTIRVNWYYHPENETAKECGEEFKEDFDSLVFNVIPSSD